MRNTSPLLFALIPTLACSGRLAASADTTPLAPAIDPRSRDGMAVEGGPQLDLDGVGPGANEETRDAPDPGRRLTKSAWLSFRVDDEREIPERVAALTQLAAEHGGYLAHEHSAGATVRVPADRLEAFVAALVSQGELLERRVEVLDVSRSYVDLESRLGTAKKSRARLLALLERAADVEDVLAIEKELARITAQVEVMEAELRQLSQQVALATVEVQYQTLASPGPIGWVFYGLYRGVKWLFVWD